MAARDRALAARANDLADDQHGAVARHQLLALGMTSSMARSQVRAGRWRAAGPGVYLTFTGPTPERTRLWTALLRAGPGAVLSHRTVLWLHGVLDSTPQPIELSVPHRRQVDSWPGVRVHRARGLPAHVHPQARPPQTRLEPAVLAVCSALTDPDEVLDIVMRATQRRRTTPARLRAAMARTARLRWRALLTEILSDVETGIASPLEWRYVQRVETPHGLPAGLRNRPTTNGLRTVYRDIWYPQWRTVVELDGEAAHPADERFRDLRRDNLAVTAGERVLRYGWRDVVGRPCEVAGQVATVLRAEGWAGRPLPCAPGCRAARVPPRTERQGEA